MLIAALGKSDNGVRTEKLEKLDPRHELIISEERINKGNEELEECFCRQDGHDHDHDLP